MYFFPPWQSSRESGSVCFPVKTVSNGNQEKIIGGRKTGQIVGYSLRTLCDHLLIKSFWLNKMQEMPFQRATTRLHWRSLSGNRDTNCQFGKPHCVPLANLSDLCHRPASGISQKLRKFLGLSPCLSPTVILWAEGNNEPESGGRMRRWTGTLMMSNRISGRPQIFMSLLSSYYRLSSAFWKKGKAGVNKSMTRKWSRGGWR